MKKNTDDQATKDRRAELEVARDTSAKDHKTKLEAATTEAEKAKIIADLCDIISRDLEHERATVEERHWQELEPLWTDSVSILSITHRFADLGVPVQWSKRANKEISELDPDDCRQFCWRDCALYVNVLMNAAEGPESSGTMSTPNGYLIGQGSKICMGAFSPQSSGSGRRGIWRMFCPSMRGCARSSRVWRPMCWNEISRPFI